MKKRMLIDAMHAEETRVVVLNGNQVEEFDFDASSRGLIVGNVYLAKVTRIEPSLQAAFVDYGGNRHGFLPFSEIHPDYFQIPAADREILLREEAEYDDNERFEQQNKSEGAQADDFASHVDAEPTETQDEADPAMLKADRPVKKTRRSPRRKSTKAVSPEADDENKIMPARVEDVEDSISEPIEASQEMSDDMDQTVVSGARSSRSRLRKYSRRVPAEAQEPAYSDASVEDLGNDEDGLIEAQYARARSQGPRPKSRMRYKIQEVIKVRQVLLVQAVKEERGNKGAALTTYLSLPGRYCVLMPNTSKGGGVSRKIANFEDRRRLKSLMTDLNVPKGAGLIIRTAGAHQDVGEIERDYAYLVRQWDRIREKTLNSTAPAPVYTETGPITRAIRDLLSQDTSEILIEGEAAYQEALDYTKILLPEFVKNVKLYKNPMPLFARYKVEDYLSGMFNPIVQLKSGGYIVIGVTEALIAVDVNSGRATRGANIEETALLTNLEAAEEIAKQLKLRDLAGLIVIDFIDMQQRRNQQEVEGRLKESLKRDRARIQVGRISSFGLLEMSRQRMRTGLVEAITNTCPHCHGTGIIRSSDNIALSVLRSIEEEVASGKHNEITVQTPPKVASFIFNEKRAHISMLEERFGVVIRIIANADVQAPDFKLEKLLNPERPLPVIDVESEDLPKKRDDKKPRKRVRRDKKEAASEESHFADDATGESAPNPDVPLMESSEDTSRERGSSENTRARTRTRRRRTRGEPKTDPISSLEAVEPVLEVVEQVESTTEPKPSKRGKALKASVRKRRAERTTETGEQAESHPKEAQDMNQSYTPLVSVEPSHTAEENAPQPKEDKSTLTLATEAPTKPAQPKKKGWWSL